MLAKIGLALYGLCAGVTVAVAVTSLVAAIGVYPRLTAKSHGARYMLIIESGAQLGIAAGTIFSVFPVIVPWLSFICPVAGFFIGAYVGCFLMALAEVLQAFPILFRRTKIKIGLSYFIICVAAGKLWGSLYYFAMEMWKK